MRYREALDFLRGREQFRVKVGLRNIRHLAERLGNPQRRIPAVVVAGTNGKGSTVAILDSVLRAHGLRVGRFTSPHLVSVEERIVLDGEPLPADDFARFVGEVAAASSGFAREYQPSFFETITAAAFLAFESRPVDAAVFEVGMGGRWDASTIAEGPVGLVSRIALDHERFLGDTVSAIAAEKGAIARSRRELIAARQQPEARRSLETRAAEAGAVFRSAEDETEVRLDSSRTGSRGSLTVGARAYEGLTLPLPGAHQHDNLALALLGAERFLALSGLGAPDPARVREGVAAARWPGRLEWLPPRNGGPPLLLDAAHNPSGAARLAEFLDSLRPARRRVLVFGAMRDKRVGEMLSSLRPRCDRIVLTAAESRRALSAEELAAAAAPVLDGAAVETAPGAEAAVERAERWAGPGGEVVVAGSIFLLGEVLRSRQPAAQVDTDAADAEWPIPVGHTAPARGEPGRIEPARIGDERPEPARRSPAA